MLLTAAMFCRTRLEHKAQQSLHQEESLLHHVAKDVNPEVLDDWEEF